MYLPFLCLQENTDFVTSSCGGSWGLFHHHASFFYYYADMYTFWGSESGVEYSRRMTTRVHRYLLAV